MSEPIAWIDETGPFACTVDLDPGNRTVVATSLTAVPKQNPFAARLTISGRCGVRRRQEVAFRFQHDGQEALGRGTVVRADQDFTVIEGELKERRTIGLGDSA